MMSRGFWHLCTSKITHTNHDLDHLEENAFRADKNHMAHELKIKGVNVVLSYVQTRIIKPHTLSCFMAGTEEVTAEDLEGDMDTDTGEDIVVVTVGKNVEKFELCNITKEKKHQCKENKLKHQKHANEMAVCSDGSLMNKQRDHGCLSCTDMSALGSDKKSHGKGLSYDYIKRFYSKVMTSSIVDELEINVCMR
ncbi:hypothetical protein CLF_106812 [Clonorchis sinensis]|uniref:Uncharacterized protein n=1 Tax=Clonorchis sinensis TaxID=79923 RepID=G7YFR7_CLOSI|nr:hypothetical protein CLF_106812 [Clonorchis sinensis]